MQTPKTTEELIEQERIILFNPGLKCDPNTEPSGLVMIQRFEDCARRLLAFGRTLGLQQALGAVKSYFDKQPSAEANEGVSDAHSAISALIEKGEQGKV